jgi:hypothetical protein
MRRLVNIMDKRNSRVPVYLFDIDGTCADHSHRLPLISADREGGKDWATFHDLCDTDPPIEAMCNLAFRLILANAPVIFLTGRMEFQRQKTQEWLALHVHYGIPSMYLGFEYFEGCDPEHQPKGAFPWLLMRAEGDFREDTFVKGEWLDRIELYFTKKMPDYNVAMAFEDRPRICELWRQRGLVVAQIGDWTEAQQAPPAEAWGSFA